MGISIEIILGNQYYPKEEIAKANALEKSEVLDEQHCERDEKTSAADQMLRDICCHYAAFV
jgi:hypothetical protein